MKENNVLLNQHTEIIIFFSYLTITEKEKNFQKYTSKKIEIVIYKL